MGVIETQIAKAEARFGPDVAAAVALPSSTVPYDVVVGDVAEKRLAFLTATLPDPSKAAETLERILFGNELQPISYFERGAIAARAVARIAIRSVAGSGWATGFMISPSVLITNNHVLQDMSTARRSLAEFEFELDLADQPTGPVSFEFDPDRLFYTSTDLDFTVVAVRPESTTHPQRLESYGFLPLVEEEGKAFEGEWLTIIQHPNGERKQVCVRENRLIKRAEQVLWYATDTMGGSSGSPVFNNDWYIVALHHSGIPERVNDRIQSIDGRDIDPTDMDETQIKWIANEGIRASRIVKALRRELPGHPMLRPLFEATPQSARISERPHSLAVASLTPYRISKSQENLTMPDRPNFPIDVRLRIDADGNASILGSSVGAEATFEAGEARPQKSRTAAFEAPFEPNYSKRKGYREDFLDKGAPVGFPEISPGLMAEVATLVTPQGKNNHVLHYSNYSVVMHARRRLAIYSAANVDFANRYDLPRPPDTWRRDPRIKPEHQLENWYYASNNFDRGHLTRREDAEYGATRLDALASAADTCHWTNCTPQHAKFNQNKEIWQGIERYILESTIFDTAREIRAQVITGPVLDDGDPEYKKIQYPVQFWKVVVALDEKKQPAATAYIASQTDVIAQFGIEVAPFGEFMHFQTTVSEIERLTGLTFVGAPGQFLRETDPLRARPRPRRSVAGAHEALVAGGAGPYWPIRELEDIST
ncbi:DNA/RNA non-specific endonuclease [Mesorhizobium sp. AR10]|uniref:DNA/RNA non-specific endonuclease n=1 Tax=Mesorhizobium sp. AR10 TaxID=2865839 RepID=UPI002160A1AE|nr:DNA/RNA non-specific endonuclease [Mesorhizobium sp. AR10]UVK38739.1 DNA/RNA non-specific endonuclease [Mesorhizobium sp. AR10]